MKRSMLVCFLGGTYTRIRILQPNHHTLRIPNKVKILKQNSYVKVSIKARCQSINSNLGSFQWSRVIKAL